MSKNRKSNKEAKKKPVLTLKEKRAAKKSKNEEVVFLVTDKSGQGTKPTAGSKRS